MTENFAISHYAREGEARIGWVGTLASGGRWQSFGGARGARQAGPGNMLGYYKNEPLTREAIDDEGFLHTGDRGEIDEKGALRLKGRVKELFKTSKGKYVAPAPLESALLAHPDIDQACVSGVGLPQPYALVVLSPGLRAPSDAGSARPSRRSSTRHLTRRTPPSISTSVWTSSSLSRRSGRRRTACSRQH